jgi:hypothetical protein
MVMDVRVCVKKNEVVLVEEIRHLSNVEMENLIQERCVTMASKMV